MKKVYRTIFIFSALFWLTACLEEPDCVSSTTNFVNLKFYNLEDNAPDTLSVESLTILGSDSILVADRDIVQVRLPLDPVATQSTFIFDTELGNDTLVLGYQVSARLVSEDCGVETIYSGLQPLRSDFDSIKVVNNILIEDVREDIKIFN